METVEAGADVWSPEAREAVNNRDHSCLPKDAEISGQTVRVGAPPQPTVATPAATVTVTTNTNITTNITTNINQPSILGLENDNNNRTGDHAASKNNSGSSDPWIWS